jgi:Zn-dependent protease
MRGGLPLFRFKGIRVLIHWSFLLLPAYIAFMGWSDGTALNEILVEIGLVMIVFVCVVLHEFGHALTAQRYGVGTRDITLLPIGGVASLERMPEDPKQEFMITVAGPLVNLVIAILAFGLIAISGISLLMTDLFQDITSWNAVLSFLVVSNLGLFLFNLIPAFPMDGGRILRSLLSMRMAREKATRIAAGIGRFMAVGFVIYGLLEGAPFLALIGLFIFMAAGSEAKQVSQQARMRSILVQDVMKSDPLRMDQGTDLQTAWNQLTIGDHRVLIVLDQGRYAGLVMRDDLRSAMLIGTHGTLVELARKAPPVHSTDQALPIYQRMLADGLLAVPVLVAGSPTAVLVRGTLADAFNEQLAKGR